MFAPETFIDARYITNPPNTTIARAWGDSPFFVANDAAYDRMHRALLDGEPYVKSYVNICPHKKKDDCDCAYMLNFLFRCRCPDRAQCACKFPDGTMVRSVNGVLKPVFSLSEIERRNRAAGLGFTTIPPALRR